METIQQRNSRVNADDLAAISQHTHKQDVLAGLATYEIVPTFGESFSVNQITPSGQLSGWAKDYISALKKVEEWKAAALYGNK
jgi:hypothetical protein